jgi:hypothetical protein
MNSFWRSWVWLHSFLIWTEGGKWLDSYPGHLIHGEEYTKSLLYVTEKMITYKKYSIFIGINITTVSGRDN